jgi:hypothetical protein
MLPPFELRPPPGAGDRFAPKKPARQRLVRASLRRFSCPCGCGRNGWFKQPRSLRGASPQPHEPS